MSAHVLEIGSGTGQHAVYFAKHLPHLVWWPTERLANLTDLAARIQAEGTPNLREASVLEASQALWPVRSVDALFTANTLHIMPWEAVIDLYRGMDRVLAPGGTLAVYGPFTSAERPTSQSNADFDLMLRARDPQSGLRDMGELTALAASHGFKLTADHDLPANNRLLVFVKEPARV